MQTPSQPLDDTIPSPARRLLVLSLALQACPLGSAAAQRGPNVEWLQEMLGAAGGDAADVLLAAVQAGALLMCWGNSPQAAAASGNAGSGPADVELRRAQLAASVEARLQRYDFAAPAPAPGGAPAVVYS